MLENIFISGVTESNLLISLGVSIVLGVIIAMVHKITASKCSKNFLITLTVIPVLVMTIILMTSGNLGSSIAIVGAFSLVRFRSLPGTSKEIMSIFYAMTIGLAIGMGEIIMAVILTLLVGFMIIVFSKLNIFGKSNNNKLLKIVIPEDMDYEDVFIDTFKKYLDDYKLINVKLINMGSLYELTYSVNEKNNIKEKEFLDDVRVINSNMKITLSHVIDSEGEL